MADPSEARELQSAIEALETQRGLLGDSVVDTSISALRLKLAELEKNQEPREQLRRQGTVLFADVSGFTSICSKNDAENVTEAINALWESLDAIIISCGGTVDKHIGDCVMAVWGASGVKEDDPVRAVEAALSMQEAASSISSGSRGLIPKFEIRIGLHSGPVFISSVGLGDEYTVMGDTVNVASRLQNLAPLGSVLVSRHTWKHLRGRFICTERPPARIKGIDEEMETFIVEGRTPGIYMGLDTSIFGRETGMVGRSRELDTLLSSFSRVVGNRCTEAVTVVGEAGIGKSRLLHEFRKRVEDRGAQIIFFNARCTPGMEDMPCGVFRDLLRISAGVLESDSSAETMEKLITSMKRFSTREEASQACFYAGFNTETSGFSHGREETMQGRSALLDFFRRASLKEPVLLYLEDLHWADPVSLDLIRDLVTTNSQGSMLALCLARPPLFQRCPDWAEDIQGRLLELGPLSEDHCMEMVSSILQGICSVPRSLAELLSSNSDGNPFYVEELLKMLVEEGAIDQETGTVHIEALSGTGVPSTLTGVLQARLDSLSPEERRVLQTASVIGRVFWDLTLGELQESLNREVLGDCLSAAEKRDMVHRMEKSAFRGSGEYLFKHAILRDVTYETVLLKARRKYHRLVARWLLENVGDRTGEFQGTIAAHFELGEEWPEALDWLLRSGDSALRTSGYNEAVSIFTRALSIPGEFLDPKTLCELLQKRGVAFEKLARYSEAEIDLRRSLRLSVTHSLAGSQAEALSTLAWIATITGRRQEAKELAFRARDAAEKAGEPDLLARAHMRMADYEEEQKYDKVLGYFSKALEIYTETGSENGIATALLNMGNVALAFEILDDAEAYYQRSLAVYTGLGSRWGMANCLANLGLVASERGDFNRARENYGRSLEISGKIGNREGVTLCNLNLGDAFLALKDPEKALVHHTKALSTAFETGLRPLLLIALRGIAEAYLSSGRRNEAAEILHSVQVEETLDPSEKRRIEYLVSEFGLTLSRGRSADILVQEVLEQ